MAGNAQHILNPQHVLKAAHKALDQGLYDECLHIVEGLLTGASPDPEATLLAGVATYYSGHHKEALAYFVPLLNLIPDYTEVHYFAANCYLKTEQYDKSLIHFHEAHRLDPTNMVDALLGMGLAYAGLKDFGNAKKHFLTALKTAPSMPNLWFEYGNFLRTFGKIEEAQKIHTLAALKEEGFLPTAHLNNVYNLGQYLIMAGDYEGAEKLFEQVLTECPDEPNSIWCLGEIASLTGDFETAFYLFESRWEIGGGHPTKRHQAFVAQDEYCGQPLENKTLLIMDEQGLGDFVLYATCIQSAIDQAKHVVIETPVKMVSLMRRSFPDATIMPVQEIKSDPYKRFYGYDWLDQAPAFDFYCGVGSLPKIFRKKLTDFCDGNYLKADPERVTMWKKQLETLGEGLKIGLCYRGGISEGTRTKSYSQIEDWQDVFGPEHKLVNLVYDAKDEELDRFEKVTGHKLHHFEGLDLFDDMENTAALISNLDLVISVASTNVELAGALGTKVVRLTSLPDWTLLGTHERPWFASQEIIGKKYFDTWPQVMGQLKNYL